MGVVTAAKQPRSDSFSPTLSSASNGLSQEEVLQHELPFPRDERAITDLAGYLPVGCLRPSFDFDDFIKRFAVRTCESIKCASNHCYAPNTCTAATDLEQERSQTLLYVGIFGVRAKLSPIKPGAARFW
jgi:hypothetical protein